MAIKIKQGDVLLHIGLCDRKKNKDKYLKNCLVTCIACDR